MFCSCWVVLLPWCNLLTHYFPTMYNDTVTVCIYLYNSNIIKGEPLLCHTTLFPEKKNERNKHPSCMEGDRCQQQRKKRTKKKDRNCIFRLKKQVICSVSIKCISIRFRLKLDYSFFFLCMFLPHWIWIWFFWNEWHNNDCCFGVEEISYNFSEFLHIIQVYTTLFLWPIYFHFNFKNLTLYQ